MKAMMLASAGACSLMLGWGSVVIAAETPAKTTHSPESIECSKQADAKGLHGKERKEFRSKCKKEFKAKAAPKNP